MSGKRKRVFEILPYLWFRFSVHSLAFLASIPQSDSACLAWMGLEKTVQNGWRLYGFICLNTQIVDNNMNIYTITAQYLVEIAYNHL